MSRRTKYHPGYGYVSSMRGGNLFSDMWKMLPPSIISAGKNAAVSAATAGIKAVGNRVGSELANRIAPLVPSASPKIDSISERKEILKDLKLNKEPTPIDISQLGFGRRKKIRGGSIKILI